MVDFHPNSHDLKKLGNLQKYMVSVCQSHPEIPTASLKDIDPVSASAIASPDERLDIYRGEYYTRLFDIAKYTILRSFFKRYQKLAEETFFAFLRQNPHRSCFLDKIFPSFPSWLAEHIPEKPWLAEESKVLVDHYFWLHYTADLGDGDKEKTMDIEKLYLSLGAFAVCPTSERDLYGLFIDRGSDATRPSGVVAVKKPGNRIHMIEVDVHFFPMITALTEDLSLVEAISFIDQDSDPKSLRDFVASLTPCLICR